MSAFEDHSGKIGSSLFREVLKQRCGRPNSRVLKGPAFGVDTSIIDIGNGQGLAVSSDPLSLIPSLGLKESAWLSVHLLANDMATTGFAPQFAQFVLNLPPDLSLESFKTYWDYIHTFCDEIGVAVTGGHTGQVPGQASTMPGGGTMFLTAPLDKLITGDGAEPGDRIVVTKETALTAASILAKSFPDTVQNKLGRDLWEHACNHFYRTSSLPDARAAASALEPKTELKAMHDVTEGGVLGAIAEMAEASGCSFRVESDLLPADPAVLKVTKLFGIDHRFSVGAGSMIMAVKEGTEEALLARLREQSIPAAVVGYLTTREKDNIIINDHQETVFSFDGKDPYWNAFFKATEEGWT